MHIIVSETSHVHVHVQTTIKYKQIETKKI
jgi:hypothetical protein